MTISTHTTLDAADIAISQMYYEQQIPYLKYVPKEISRPADLHELKTSPREKPKEATRLYRTIRNKFLFNLDKMLTEAVENMEEFSDEIIKILSDKESKKGLQDVITKVRSTKDNLNRILIQYDKLTWFKDPNLISTIKFHEKLFDIFMGKVEESLDCKIDLKKIKKVVKAGTIDKEYIKSIMVIVFQPLLAYGAIYASIQNDFAYIIKYHEIVSESAEVILNKNPSMKHLFIEQRLS